MPLISERMDDIAVFADQPEQTGEILLDAYSRGNLRSCSWLGAQRCGFRIIPLKTRAPTPETFIGHLNLGCLRSSYPIKLRHVKRIFYFRAHSEDFLIAWTLGEVIKKRASPEEVLHNNWPAVSRDDPADAVRVKAHKGVGEEVVIRVLSG